MDSTVIQEEIEALQSIYCRPNEFQLNSLGTSEVSFSLTIKSVTEPKLIFQLNICLGSEYPAKVPELSVQCSTLTRTELEHLNESLNYKAKNLIGQPMILELTQIVIEYHPKHSFNKNEEKDDVPASFGCVAISLDHIRSRTVYYKTLTKWFEELDLYGVLAFFKHRIFLFVSGDKEDVQSYLKWHRTQNIDIDSSGRPCKERLLSILGEDDTHFHCEKRLSVEELKTIEDFERVANRYGIFRLYSTHIKFSLQR